MPTENFQMVKPNLEKPEEPANIHWITGKSKRIPQKFCVIDCAEALNVWVTANCGKFLKKWKY